jgi:hypothetical protein
VCDIQVYIDESGDFLLVPTALFHSVAGNSEAPYNTHIDSLSLLKLASVADGVYQSIFDFPVYHQPHDKISMARPSVALDTVIKWGEYMMCRGPAAFMESDWGLRDVHLDEQQFYPPSK